MDKWIMIKELSSKAIKIELMHGGLSGEPSEILDSLIIDELKTRKLSDNINLKREYIKQRAVDTYGELPITWVGFSENDNIIGDLDE